MTFTFRPAIRENVPLLIGLAAGTGGGKTWSAMELAKGLAGGKRFAVCDTENGRARHYADDFDFDAADLTAPFRPERYADAIQDADAAGYPVIVVDSMSHEWAGDGGMLDWQEEEFQRMGGRNEAKMSSWIAPKAGHRKMVTRLLQVKAHVILCFRAAERVDMVRDGNGKMQVVPKRSLIGLDGWMPITDRNLPFELTASFLLTADKPGYPKPIKLPAKLAPFFPLDSPITESAGVQLAAWAAGGTTPVTSPPAAAESSNGTAAVMELAERVGPEATEATERAIREHIEKHGTVNKAWLGKLHAALESRLPAEPEPQQEAFPIPAGAR